MHKSTILVELTRELKMRRDVWNNVRTPQGPVFQKKEHQWRYESLNFLSEVLPEIYPHEWDELCARRECTLNRLAAEADQQLTLF